MVMDIEGFLDGFNVGSVGRRRIKDTWVFG